MVFSLLPAADSRCTEVSLNTVQGRLAGFIHLIHRSALSEKGAEAGFEASRNLLAAAIQNNAHDVITNVALHADINYAEHDGMNAIMHAAINGNLGMMKALIATDAGVNAANKHGKTALILAAKKDMQPLLTTLSAGAWISRRQTARTRPP